MIHNLDKISANLNSTEYFPSRVSIDLNNIKKLDDIVRRLYRFFSHCYFNHQMMNLKKKCIYYS